VTDVASQAKALAARLVQLAAREQGEGGS